MFDLGNTKNKWLDHMEESHKDEFDDLVQRIRLSNQALHEAIQNIVDDEVCLKRMILRGSAG
jgi:hypothetical protein